MWNQLAISIITWNIYVIFMLLLAFIGTIIIIERFTMLSMVYNINFSKFLINFRKAVRSEDFDRAMHLCKTSSHASLPKIGRKALEAAERDPSSVRGTIEEETIEILPQLETRLRMIPTIATVILLVGIVATIDGLWEAFKSIEVLDSYEKQMRLSHGVAGALIPTVLGLLICMIFIAAHQILQGIAIKLTDKIHHGTTVLINLLVPPEVAYMAAAPATGGHIDVPTPDPTPIAQQTDTSAPAPSKPEEEEFEDAAVEDIKDEEEII